MSILLEALRKSEKSQRAHEVPTIHVDDEVTTVPESLATGPLAMLLVSTLFMSGWFVWHQYQIPASAARQAVTGTQEPAPDNTEAAVGSQSPVADSPKSPPALANQPAVARTQPALARQQPPVSGAKDGPPIVKTPVSSETGTARVKPTIKVADKSADKQRTPMESYKAPARRARKTKQPGSERVAVTPPPTKVVARPASTKTADTGNNQSTGNDANPKKPVVVARSEPRPEIPRPISYWELPDSIRANVPEIKFSVLVYATNPSDRFVLINGERLVEGGNAAPGLVVKEIRRDGVIFSYRSYQFLVEK